MANVASVTDNDFQSMVLESQDLVLVDFWAEWCGPCRALAPKLEEIAEEMGGKVKVMKVNIDQNPESPAKYGVRGIPTLILFKGGEEVGQLVGNVAKEKITETITGQLS